MRRVFPALSLALALVAAAACGVDPEPAPKDHPSLASAPPEGVEDAGGLPLPQDGGASGEAHAATGSIRCARCHTEADRDHPQWKERAKRLGHDVSRNLRDRTTCTCCHLGEVKGFGAPIDRMCLECHENVRVAITAMGKMHCVSCHNPSLMGGAGIRESAWECRKCHAKAQGDKRAIDVHGAEDCKDCHRPHAEPWTIPRRCADCHPKHETGHGDGKPRKANADAGAPRPPHGESAECSTCHRPHEVGGDAASRCAECHMKRSPTLFARATFAGGHERCTTCHEPHDAAKGGPKPCKTCHAAIATMAVPGRGAALHATCTTCHAQHDVKQSASQACATCHTQVHPDHPDPAGVGCIGCHNPHPTSMPTAAARATGSPPTSGVACTKCHERATSNTAFHAGTTPCTGCHVPHAFSRAKVVPCAQCHKPETRIAAAGGKHSDCKGCHTPHAPTAPKPACASCHALEASTAPVGHAKCLNCHSEHPASRAPKSECVACHARKKVGPHVPLPCTTCHRAHAVTTPSGPGTPVERPPACTTCHDKSKLPGIHEKAGHAECTNCHGGHKAPSSDRATCLSCHADRNDHEPTAKVCAGCHAFGKGR